MDYQHSWSFLSLKGKKLEIEDFCYQKLSKNILKIFVKENDAKEVWSFEIEATFENFSKKEKNIISSYKNLDCKIQINL